MIVTTVTTITTSLDTDDADRLTHHNVEVKSIEGADPAAVKKSVIDGCIAAMRVAEDQLPDADPPSVTAEREQDFESGSQQEG